MGSGQDHIVHHAQQERRAGHTEGHFRGVQGEGHFQVVTVQRQVKAVLTMGYPWANQTWLVLEAMAHRNQIEISDFPSKTSIPFGDFPAMFEYQRVSMGEPWANGHRIFLSLSCDHDNSSNPLGFFVFRRVSRGEKNAT